MNAPPALVGEKVARPRYPRTGYGANVRLATWNVNSALSRLPRLLPWLDQRAPDVVCLQETKLSDDAFAESFDEPLRERGYVFAHVGEGRWNGVALLSRVGLDDVVRELPDVPRFPTPDAAAEARAVTATCGGLRVTSVYVPNGRTPDDPHYAYKLEWLAALRESVGAPATAVIAGDMNIAPTDADVWDPALFTESTHVTPAERKALAELLGLGLHDVLRDRWPSERMFSYWDYRAGRFHQDKGMRIDLVLAGADPAGRVAAAWVDRQARKGSGPSDHAPLIVDLDDALDGDIGPVVPPPSNPRR
jgi:exodeoxyribonuclease-3